MSFFRAYSLKQSSRHCFVLIAFVAMMMNQLTATGFVHSVLMPASASGFAGDICTTVGTTKLPLSSGELAPAQETAVDHSCCGACVAGSAPLVSYEFNGVPPAPTDEFLLPVFNSPRPARLAASSHRPRGPPLV